MKGEITNLDGAILKDRLLEECFQSMQAILHLNRTIARRPARVVMVAMANKTACIAWALLARGDVYRAASYA